MWKLSYRRGRSSQIKCFHSVHCCSGISDFQKKANYLRDGGLAGLSQDWMDHFAVHVG